MAFSIEVEVLIELIPYREMDITQMFKWFSLSDLSFSDLLRVLFLQLIRYGCWSGEAIW